MNAVLRLVLRRRLSRRSRLLCFVCWFIASLLFASISIFFFYAVFVYHCCSRSSETIVSLTTTPKRFTYELPIAVYSLLGQTVLPKEIRIYLSPSSLIRNLSIQHLKLAVQHLDSSSVISRLFDRLVQIWWEENDYGPATKFLPIIREFHSNRTHRSQSQAIIICDDDHYYHPHVIETLNRYARRHEQVIVGLRGWRSKHLSRVLTIMCGLGFSFSVRDDLTWGVSGAEESAYHIVESFRLAQAYRVGVVTANYAYLIRPSFFDSHFYEDFSSVAADIRRVDDIWLNGQAAKRNISRYVVPSCCPNIGVTRTHELETYLINHQMTRSSANDHALKWFEQAWERELWYRFKGVNRPKYRSRLISIYRQWISLIVRLKIIFDVGFV